MKPSQPAAPKLVQDVSAPASASPQTTELIKTELQHSIPVKRPDAAPPKPNVNPIQSMAQPAESKNDKDLEHVLKDVSKKMDEPEKMPESKAAKVAAQKQKIKKSISFSVPVWSAAAAVVVAIALSVAAVYAFKTNQKTVADKAPATPSKVGTSADSSAAVQAAGGTLVQANDLINLSSDMQSKLNSLNDAQEFNSTDLSDSNLGL